MIFFGRLLAYLLLASNFLLIGAMVACAYSPLIDPRVVPFISCLGLLFPIMLGANVACAVFWLFFHRRYAWFSLAGILLCLPQVRNYMPLNFSTTPQEGSLKVLSYNVMSFGNLRKENGRNAVLDYLSTCNADIICLQEYNVATTSRHVTSQDIRKALKAYPYSSVRKEGTACAQLACFSKYPILSATPIVFGTNANGAIKYLIKVGTDTMLLINNHLESYKLTKQDRGMYEQLIAHPDSQQMRRNLYRLLKKQADASAIRATQADSVARIVAESRHATAIVCGDLNDSAISYTHHILTRRMNDAFTRAGSGPGISYHHNKFYFRIDHMLISPNLRAEQCVVDCSIKASDHYPIWCYVRKR